MKVVKLLVISAALAAASASANASTYVAYDQFEVTSAGITTTNFAFGYVTGSFTGSATPFTTFQPACGGNILIECARTGEVSVSKAGTYDPPGTNYYVDGFLTLHPGEDNVTSSVVQFIAPTAGLYSFEGLFRSLDGGTSGVGLSAFVGATSQFTQLMQGGFYDFDFNATLAANDRVSFLVGPAGDFRYDSTGLKLAVTALDTPVSGVPEPGTWAMMIAGFGLVGGAIRRRRAFAAA